MVCFLHNRHRNGNLSILISLLGPEICKQKFDVLVSVQQQNASGWILFTSTADQEIQGHSLFPLIMEPFHTRCRLCLETADGDTKDIYASIEEEVDKETYCVRIAEMFGIRVIYI